MTDDIKKSALTVAEAMNVEPGYWITVKGYIVAAAESSIKNADFRAPFAGKTAILLADEPADGSDDQYFDDLMPISLSDATKGISASFNLQENATRWNNFVYIHGIRKQYMSAPGIKEVKNIWIGDPDKQPDPTVVPDDNGNDNPDDPDNPVIDDGDDSDALTIAEAIDALWDQKIWVKGYIVGTTKQNLKNTKFDGILENFTAIVLADEPGTTQKELLFPVGLETEDRQKLAQYGDNLINMKVKVLGMKGQKGYMGQAGFKTAGAVIIIE
ncbi:MAG: hypothetical protein J6T05_03610 [Prevotella sp.]|nr:hypothetical protein [Prevotella sp.]